MAKLPKNLQEIVDKKQDYIDKNRNKLESSVIKLQEAFLQKFIEEVLPELETKDGTILNTSKNLRLIEKLDKIYNEFNTTNQSKVVKTLGESLLGLNKLNTEYFSEITVNDVTKKRFDSVSSKADKLLSSRVGVNEDGEIIKGGYLDSFITDNSLLTDLKQTVVKHVTSGQSLTDFRKIIKEKIVGNKEITGGFEKYYRTYAYDTYQQYDRAYGNQMATEFKLDYAVYQGGLINDSRDFCRDHENHVYTREEVADFGKWTYEKAQNISTFNDPGSQSGVPSYIKSNKNYDPFTDCGSYNCRHQLSWITKQAAERLRPDLKKSESAQVDELKINDTVDVQTPKTTISSKKEKQTVEKEKGLSIDEAKVEMNKVSFSDNEKEAVTTYTKGNYTQINSYLRGQRNNISSDNSKVVSELDSFVKKAPKVEAESYRGLSFSDKSEFDKFIGLKKGSVYTDNGFISTTYDKKVVDNFITGNYQVLITIKGKNGVYIEYLSDAKKEKEILFGKGSSFKVTAVKTVKKGNGFGRVDMELTEI